MVKLDKIFLLGGTGYLGLILQRYFRSICSEIVVVSRAVKQNNKTSSYVKYIDLRRLSYLHDWVEPNGVIVDLAGYSAKDSVNKFKEGLNYHHHYHQELLTELVKKGAKKYIYISTAHVYKAIHEGVITSKTSLMNPHPYAILKHLGEENIKKSLTGSNVDFCIVRLSNTFGGIKLEDKISGWDLVGNNFIKQAVINKEITIFNKKNVMRNYITDEDFARGIQWAIKNRTPKIMNLGGELNIDLLGLGKKIKTIVEHELSTKIKLNHSLISTDTKLNYISDETSSIKNNNYEKCIKKTMRNLLTNE